MFENLHVLTISKEIIKEEKIEENLGKEHEISETEKFEEFEEMNQRKKEKLKPSTEDPPKLEIKKLPEHLEYTLLEENS